MFIASIGVKRALITVLAGSFALLSPGAAQAGPTAATDTTPPSGKITVDVVTVNGSGCPAGTATVRVSPDNTSFTVAYRDHVARVGVGASPTEWRRNCQLSLLVHVPQGFTYAIAQAEYQGRMELKSGATATQLASYYFQGSSATTRSSHPFRGPRTGNWQVTDQMDVAALEYAPCGEERNVNINTELRVRAGTSDPTQTSSYIAMNSTQGSINTVYQFAWKHC